MTIHYPFIVFLAALLAAHALPAQIIALSSSSHTHKSPPPWVRGEYPEVPTDQSYQFKVGRGDGPTLFEAQQKAVFDFFTGLPSVTRLNATCRNQLAADFIEGKKSASDKIECDDDIYTSVMSLNARLDQYTYREKDGRYHVEYLFAYLDPGLEGQVKFDPPTPAFTDRYGLPAGLRSAVVPGWGQFHKRNTARGILFLAGTAGLATATFFYENNRSTAMRKSMETSKITIIKYYRDRADEAESFRNIMGMAAIALWAYNIVDAISTRGAVKYNYKGRTQFYATAHSIGLKYTL